MNGSFIIRKYSLIYGPPLLLGEFQIVVHNFIPKRFFLFKEYLIAYDQYSTTISIYNDTTFQYLGTRTFSQSPSRFLYAKSKGLILFSCEKCILAYILEANFPFTSDADVNYIFDQYNSTLNFGYLSKTE